jgi:hypothetical protein
MRRIDVEKKRAARWPWLLGVVVLALVLWGVTVLSRAPEEEVIEPAGVTTPDTLPPALIPSRPTAIGPQRQEETGRAVSDFTEADIGEVARVAGEVVATGHNAFWVLAGSHVLRVDSEQRVRRGDTVSVEGTIRPADGEATDRMASEVMSRQGDFADWTIVRTLKLVDSATLANGDG